MYILDGKPADVKNVVQEQRIRIQRGLVTLTPVEDAGLVSREEFDEKCAEIEDLRKEVEFYKNQVPTMRADSKAEPAADEKAAHADYTKESPVPDEKKEEVDSKKTKKGK